jgi:hypothetical protein
VSEPDALPVRIQQRMADGTLPCEDCVVTWYGSGHGRQCAACDQRILEPDTAIDCDVPGGGTIHFHLRCYELWHSLLAS